MNTLHSNKANLLKTLLVLGATSAVTISANASDAIGPGDSDSKWVLGVAVGGFNNPFIGEGNDGWISPTVRYNGKRIFINDDSLNIHITKSNNFSAGLKVALDGGFLSDKDNYRDNVKLAGLTERKGTVLAGIYVNHDTDLGRLSFSTLTDAADKHDGRMASLKYTFDLNAGNWNINPELGAQWLSADYVNHYVGVSDGEATISRPQYDADDTFIAFAGIRARYEMTENWDINIKTGISKLGSEYKDSPIIDDDVVYQASFGVNYNF
ncbi:MipA/OmpV family protein [Arenicella sp. 4NH20-0111]|uniref:MipA/OmpV family protein n=1 Tax=Arenicella sp. 4NH20-0111 TaxID=3127648 RepID=UPI003109B1B2